MSRDDFLKRKDQGSPPEEAACEEGRRALPGSIRQARSRNSCYLSSSFWNILEAARSLGRRAEWAQEESGGQRFRASFQNRLKPGAWAHPMERKTQYLEVRGSLGGHRRA